MRRMMTAVLLTMALAYSAACGGDWDKVNAKVETMQAELADLRVRNDEDREYLVWLIEQSWELQRMTQEERANWRAAVEAFRRKLAEAEDLLQ